MHDIFGLLACRTPESWLQTALQNIDLLLLDHKACEYKAASHAFHLMRIHGHKIELVQKMSKLAREELSHFEKVIRILKARKIPIKNISASRYAGALRQLIRPDHELSDTLVIGAFTEARSCERFFSLAPLLDDELGKFYNSLLKAELRHFKDYLDLAFLYDDEIDVVQFITKVRRVEGELILSPDTQFRFHSGAKILPFCGN